MLRFDLSVTVLPALQLRFSRPEIVSPGNAVALAQ
jgi:hypothetical protein